MKLNDVGHAIDYAWHRKISSPRRLREWRSHNLPFIFTTPQGNTFELYPDQTIDMCIFVDGAYEPRFLEVVERGFRNKPGTVMIDIGANIGNHAVYLSRSFDRIICFEPSPVIAERLLKNIALNGLANVEVHTIGLSNRDAFLHYQLDDTGNLGASHFQDAADETTINLPVRRGDDYLAPLGIERLDFIKVDVEHHELEVFEGLEKTINRFRPIVAFEFHGTSQGSAYLAAISNILSNYIFTEATFAPWHASSFEKLIWQIRHHGMPTFERINDPEPRFYENVIAFPNENKCREFSELIASG